MAGAQLFQLWVQRKQGATFLVVWIWALVVPTAFTMSPKSHPNELKVVYLKCKSRNSGPCLPWPLRSDLWVFIHKRLVMTSQGNR